MVGFSTNVRTTFAIYARFREDEEWWFPCCTSRCGSRTSRYEPGKERTTNLRNSWPKKFHNENHCQRKPYKRHIANVSITPVIIISALQMSTLYSAVLMTLPVPSNWCTRNLWILSECCLAPGTPTIFGPLHSAIFKQKIRCHATMWCTGWTLSYTQIYFITTTVFGFCI